METGTRRLRGIVAIVVNGEPDDRMLDATDGNGGNLGG